MVSYVKLSSFTLCFVWLNADTFYFTAPLSRGENPKCQFEILQIDLGNFLPTNSCLDLLEKSVATFVLH